jgi:hypothetical protein
MLCVAPPALNDGQLLSFLDGDADPATIRHLAACPACRRQAQQLAQMIKQTTTYLYRLDCPSTTELGEYQLGVLPRAQAANVAAHLAMCPHCWGEIAQLQQFLNDTAADIEVSVLERVKVFIARLISGGGTPTPFSFAPAGIRGAGGAPLVYEAADTQITLTVEAQEDQPDKRTLLGLLSADTTATFDVQLLQDEQVVAQTTVDESDNFVLTDLPPGAYDMTISGVGMEIHIQDLLI